MQDISENYEQILIKFGGDVCVRVRVRVSRMNGFDFGEDPDPRIFLSDSSPLRDRVKLIYSTVPQKVADGFR